VIAAVALAWGRWTFISGWFGKAGPLTARRCTYPFSPPVLSKQLGSKPHSVARTFRPVLANWLRKIKGLWPRHLPRWQLSDCHLFTEVPSHQLRAKVSSPVGLPTCSCQLIYLQNDTCSRDLHRGSSDEVLTSARTGYAGSCCPSAGDQEPRKKVRRIVMRV